MKVGIYDIKDIPSTAYVKGPLLVRINKLKSLFYLLLIIISWGGIFSVTLNQKKSMPTLGILFMIVIIILGVGHSLPLYLNSKKKTPYLLVDEDGVSFKNEKYPWSEIESIKFERYKTNSYAERLLLLLKDKKEIVIQLESAFIDADMEKIAGYINYYYV
jgi:hypothetical protein